MCSNKYKFYFMFSPKTGRDGVKEKHNNIQNWLRTLKKPDSPWWGRSVGWNIILMH